jgi:hypothetical protein
MKERLGLNTIFNSDYHKPDGWTIHVYIIDIATLQKEWKPRSFEKILKLTKENCRAIKEPQIIYCDDDLLNRIQSAGKFQEQWGGILSHEIGHIVDEEIVFKKADQLYEQRIDNLISLIDRAQNLIEQNENLDANKLISKVEQSEDKNDLRVVAKLASFYFDAHQYKKAYLLYDYLIAEGKRMFKENDEKYLDVLGFQSLAAHCLVALEQNDQAKLLYQNILVNKTAEGSYAFIKAQAGIIRIKYSHKIPINSGLVVVSTKPDSEGKRLGLVSGDILVSINGNALYLPKDVGELLNQEGSVYIDVFKVKLGSFARLDTNENRLGITISIF